MGAVAAADSYDSFDSFSSFDEQKFADPVMVGDTVDFYELLRVRRLPSHRLTA